MKKKVLFSGILLAFQVLLGHAQQRLLGGDISLLPLTRRQELYIEMQLESRLLPLTFSRNKVGMLFVYGFSLSLPKPPRSIREKEYARIWIT